LNDKQQIEDVLEEKTEAVENPQEENLNKNGQTCSVEEQVDQPEENETEQAEQERQIQSEEQEPPEIKMMKEKQEALEKELTQTKEQLLRLTADFDNYRKRTVREKAEWGNYAVQCFIEKILPVLDGLEQATATVSAMSAEAQKTIEGFLMIHRQLLDILSQEGLKEIPALGETFDPNMHEAMMQAPPEEGQKDNEIVMVFRKGYMFKDKVIRASMVKVAKEDC